MRLPSERGRAGGGGALNDFRRLLVGALATRQGTDVEMSQMSWD